MLKRLTNIEPEERGAALVLAIYYFLMMGAYVMGSSATSSLFLDRVQESDSIYPLLMAFNAAVTVTVVTVFSRLARRLPLLALTMATNVVFALALFTLEGVLRFYDAGWVPRITTGAMNVLVLGHFTTAGFQYYLIASTMFNARQSKRVLGVIGVGGAFATILGGLALAPFIDLMEARYQDFGTEAVVLLVATLLILMAFVIRFAGPYMVISTQQDDAEDQDEQTTQNPLRLMTDPYILTLMVVIGAFILIATTIDYQFQIVGDEHFSDAEAFTSFKGYYTAVSGALQAVMRLFVISPVLVNFGLLAGLLVLPLTIVGTTTAFLFNPNLWTAAFMKGGDQGTRFTINETAVELSWVPVPAEQRVVIKPIVSGAFIAVMQGIAGLLIYGIKQLNLEDPLRLISFAVLGLCAIWIPTTIILRRGYLRKLMESIQKRQIDFEDLNIDTADSAIVATVEESLRKGTDSERAFMLDMIESVSLVPWVPALRDVYHQTQSIAVKERILRLSAQYPQILTEDELRRLIESKSELTDEAMIAAGERNMVGVEPTLMKRLRDSNTEIRAAAARALVELGSTHADQGVKTLRNLLQLNDHAANRYALDAVCRLEPGVAAQIAPPELLRDLLKRPPVLRYYVLLAVAHTKAPLLPELVVMLGQPTNEHQIRRILKQYPTAQAKAELIRQYQNEDVPLASRAAISRAFNDYLDEAILKLMVQSLESQARAIYNEAVDTILVYARQYDLPSDVLDRLEGEGLKLARSMYSLHIALEDVQAEREPLLAEALRLDIEDMTPTLLKLSIMDVPHTDIESVIYRLQAKDPHIIGNVLEILDNVLSSAERAAIIPLFEDLSAEELAQIGRTQFPDLDESLEDELVYYINHGSELQCATALDYIMRHPQLNIQLGKSAMNISKASRQLMARQGTAGAAETLASRPERQETHMLSILEKTVLLKNTILFEEINARELYHIAQITEDVHLSTGETLFRVGEPGDTMYVIVRGEIRIHNDDVTIATLKEGNAMGEIALLDHKPRTATATAVTEAQLLSIQADAFFSTVTAHVNINRSIMQMLAGRVRHLLATEHERISADGHG